MDILNLGSSIQKKTVKAGTVLILQGSTVDSILILHSGMAELMTRQDFRPEMKDDHQRLLEDSIRVGLVKGQSVCGILGLYNGSPLEYSVVCVSECIISNTVVEDRMIVATLQKNMRLNIQVLQALVQRIESAFFLFSNYKYLWHKLASIQDGIALAADLGDSAEPETIPDRYTAGMEEYRNYLLYQMEQIGIRSPETWDPNVFLGRIQNELDLYMEYDSMGFERMIDNSQYLFIKRILRKNDKIIAGIFYQDEPTNFYVFQFLGNCLESMMRYNLGIARHISELSDQLYAGSGWVERICALNLEDNQAYRLFRHYLWKFSWRCHRDAIKLLHRDFTLDYPAFKALTEFRTPPAKGEESPAASGGENIFIEDSQGGRLDKYGNVLERILEFSEMSREFCTEFRSCLGAIRNLPDYLSDEGEHTALRTQFTALYWRLYEVCFLKVIDTDLKAFIPGIMLHFGLVDESLLSPEQLDVLDRAYSKMLYITEPVHVMTLPYFLEKIYTGEIQPSIDEMGRSFREVLAKQDKMSKKERDATELFFTDTPEDRVRYEIQMVSRDMGGLLSGSKTKNLPILSNQTPAGSLERLLLDPETCAEHAKFYRDRDISLFYREVVSRHKLGTDIIRQEILPHFVLYPLSGSRMMMWQELDGPRKDTPARFMLPLYFTENPREQIGNLLGQFRWEISRSAAGANWMDPVEGGLAGAYYDYIQFFKKNPKLSSAHKEKIQQLIKKTRSDRDRFCSDYITWLLYEYEGKLRFNPVVRDIFYRFIHFSAEMRETMAAKPLYTDLETKFQNRLRKDQLKLESRIKKFEKSGVPLPDEIAAYRDFLES